MLLLTADLFTWQLTYTLPLPPSTPRSQVGVGAFVLNESNEVLVVQEALGPLKGKGVWKMPTGLVHQGEPLFKAAALCS